MRIDHPFVKLTPRQFDVLEKMSNGADIVCSGIDCWLDYERTSWRVVRRLLAYVLISYDGVCNCYNINESGKRYLAGETLIYTIADKNGDLIDSANHGMPLIW